MISATLRHTPLRRRHVAAARARAEREILARTSAHTGASRARILCYHAVGTPAWGINDIDPARFRAQIEHALHAGYRFVSVVELIAKRADRTLAITFDDGLSSVATGAAPILRSYGIPFTTFVVPDWADGKHGFAKDTFMGWAQIEALACAGGSVGSHSLTHANFARIGLSQAAIELGASRETIDRRLGIRPSIFAIPFGCSRDWTPGAARAAREAGYETVLAQSEDRRPPDTVGRTFITRWDDAGLFGAALAGAFDRWEEWV